MESRVAPALYEAFRKIKEKDYAGAEALLRDGIEAAKSQSDATQQALFHSAFGVLYKVKEEFKEAWRHYEAAEKLLPEDPSLKIITAKLLIEQFAQYDTAIRKLRQVLKIAKGSPSFEHQAHAILALAHLKKGEKKKGAEMLKLAAASLPSLVSAENINLEVMEAFIARNYELELCRTYLQAGLTLAQTRKEEKPIQLFSRLLAAMEPPTEHPA